MEYSDDAVVSFPRGLFGFEEERRFVVIENPAVRPILFLQSLSTPALCFLALPVFVVDPGYRLELSPEDLEVCGLPVDEQPRIGGDLLCLTLVTVREGQPTTANLLAPLVVCMRRRQAVQAISIATRYSHEEPFLEPAGSVACW